MRQHAARRIAKVLRLWQRRRLIRIQVIEIGFKRDRLKAVGRIARRASAVDGQLNAWHYRGFYCGGGELSRTEAELCLAVIEPRSLAGISAIDASGHSQ